MIWILAYLISGLVFLVRDVLKKKFNLDNSLAIIIIIISYLLIGLPMMIHDLYRWCRNE